MTTEPHTTAELDGTAGLDAATRERIARLQARRGGSGATAAAGTDAATRATAPATPASRSRRRRRHPAKNSRIAATAAGLSAMFGLVAAYGVAAHADGPELTQVAPPVPAQVEPIVIQVRLVGLDGASVASSASPPVSGAAQVATAAPAPGVAAAPEVRVLSAPSAPAAAAPAPVVEASTNGSR